MPVLVENSWLNASKVWPRVVKRHFSLYSHKAQCQIVSRFIVVLRYWIVIATIAPPLYANIEQASSYNAMLRCE